MNIIYLTADSKIIVYSSVLVLVYNQTKTGLLNHVGRRQENISIILMGSNWPSLSHILISVLYHEMSLFYIITNLS